MWRRALVLVAINLLVFVVLAEAMALALYYADTGQLFYRHRKRYAPIPETQRGELTGDALHPYFGPIHRPGVRPETNNFGFGSPYAFPFRRTGERQFIVGIFGGSVARYFCDQGMPRVAASLTRHAAFANREIVPLCFSHEGYKQPQQLIVLGYFLSLGQDLDLVLNIDGFNEVALGTYNHERGRDISMPSPIHLDSLVNAIDASTMTPAKIESMAAIARGKQRLNDLADRMTSNRLASVNFALDRLYTTTRRRYQAEVVRFASLHSNPGSASLVLVTPTVEPRDAATLYRDIASQWAGASRLMHQMLTARGVPYLHVLQPNQYFGRRRFSPEEARVAINAATPFKPPVEVGYPELLRGAASLASMEHFADATGLFDREPAAVYQDDCCHYTQRGNDLLADFIAERVLAIAR